MNPAIPARAGGTGGALGQKFNSHDNLQLLKEQLLRSTSIPNKFCGALAVAPSITATYNTVNDQLNYQPVMYTSQRI